MDVTTETILRTQLQERRQRLAGGIATAGDSAPLVRLLQEVDAALERLDTGTYGLCDICHDPVEQERLMADPLLRNCLDHLTPDQQRALEQDLDLAGRIQGELLPERNLRVNGWEVGYHYEGVGPVSGDYCDVLTTGDGALVFLLGDVSGKGIAASMLMSHLHAMFRSLITVGLPFDQLMQQANRVFCESTLPGVYATLVCGKAGRTGEVEICNAGHCPPLLIRNGTSEGIEANGLPLGLFCSGPFGVTRLAMNPGDSLLLYTDGLSEARNSSNTEYGVDRLARVARDNGRRPPQAIVGACLQDLAAFLSGVARTDDLAVMAVQRAA